MKIKFLVLAIQSASYHGRHDGRSFLFLFLENVKWWREEGYCNFCEFEWAGGF